MRERLLEFWDRFLVPVDDPGSRLFHLNILVSLVLIVVWLFLIKTETPLGTSLKKLVFNRRYWWNRSTRFDYSIYLFNSVLKIFLFIPFLDFSYQIGRFTSQSLLKLNGGEFAGWSAEPLVLLAFTTTAFIWDDLLRFSQHWLMHHVPFLWRLHRVHHSAHVLTPITLYRNHPIESAIATVRNSLSFGVMIGLFIFLFESRFSLVTLFGVNIFGFLFNFLGANLRHSHIPITFGPWAEKILISPKQHQIHHSRRPEHFDKNLGVSLAIWDQLCGSLVLSRGVGRLRFGLRRD